MRPNLDNSVIKFTMIFEEQVSRKPDHYPWVGKFIEAMHNGFWTDKEFSFTSDLQDFNVRLNEQEKEIIVRTLSAIGQIEVAVKKFWSKLGDNLPHPSFSDLGFVMANVEVIHNNAYERLLEVLGLEEVFEENLQTKGQGLVAFHSFGAKNLVLTFSHGESVLGLETVEGTHDYSLPARVRGIFTSR